jgi:putative nucleotidyltransferase with HDIG domain
MSKETLLAELTSNPRLPTPPSVALQILDKANRPQCTIGDLSKIISHDPALCGRILKLVNSSLFGLPRAVTSIDRALQMLGLNRVRSLVLSLSLPAMQKHSKSNPQMRDFWKASVATAITARALAAQLQLPDPDSEMVAGLLCDLGILILQEINPEGYLHVMDVPAEVLIKSQCEIEERHFGVHHAEVSAFMLRKWRLPEDVTEAIAHHHHPENAASGWSQRAHLLHFASRVAMLQVTVRQSSLLGDIVAMARNRFGMDDRQFQTFFEPLTDRMEELASLLQIDIGACHDFSTLLARATENLTRLAVETSLDNFRVHAQKAKAESDLKQAERALETTEQHLRHAVRMEAVGRLAGGVAHDFNNMLTVINGYSELLLNVMAPSDPHREFVAEIKQAGDRASDLTRQLLAFSRKQFLKPEVINLNDVVAGMDKMLRRLIGEDIELVTALDGDLENVKVDPTQIDQVIMNLVVNARDAMPRGGKLTIETENVRVNSGDVAACPELRVGDYVLMTVSDNGVGMTEEIRARVFEPFFSTKDAEGTGLGLATVHGIIKQSDGHIEVYSEVEAGSAFKVYLPAVREALSTHSGSSLIDADMEGNETILLAEDDDSVRLVARRMLEVHGYTVLEARNGAEALRLSEQYADVIQLLVTDTIMPHMGGCELAQRLTQQRPDIRVLFASGYTDDAVIRHGVLTATTPFLQKPFTPQALAVKVREVLNAGMPF